MSNYSDIHLLFVPSCTPQFSPIGTDYLLNSCLTLSRKHVWLYKDENERFHL
jgi:hypothetical protein